MTYENSLISRRNSWRIRFFWPQTSILQIHFATNQFLQVPSSQTSILQIHFATNQFLQVPSSQTSIYRYILPQTCFLQICFATKQYFADTFFTKKQFRINSGHVAEPLELILLNYQQTAFTCLRVVRTMVCIDIYWYHIYRRMHVLDLVISEATNFLFR